MIASFALVLASFPASGSEMPGFAGVIERARDLAQRAYRAPNRSLPTALSALSYDEYRDIRFRIERAIWRAEGLPFQLQLFHRGYLFPDRVQLNLSVVGGWKRVAWDPTLFDYGGNKIAAELDTDFGFSGFRVHHAINRDDYLDELLVFLGASYFRALGRGHKYGLSMRAVAIDTGLDPPEEFPAFREFWIVKPTRGSRSITIHALLDGPSLSGAYALDVLPGSTTVLAVRAVLYFRRSVGRLGVAPLTSMFLRGELGGPGALDHRPEVHDSDGLLVESGANLRSWRPLSNPTRPRVSEIRDETGMTGFGLMQRDRDFDHYQDLEADYQRRPSAWVEPATPWDGGAVVLLELPTGSEGNDNIVAFWSPDEQPEAGSAMELAYRVHVLDQAPRGRIRGRVHGTRLSAVPRGSPLDRRFLIDFELPSDSGERPMADVGATGGAAVNIVVERNAHVGGWRVMFDVRAETDDDVDLRCVLLRDGLPVTETWRYRWTPDSK